MMEMVARNEKHRQEKTAKKKSLIAQSQWVTNIRHNPDIIKAQNIMDKEKRTAGKVENSTGSLAQMVAKNEKVRLQDKDRPGSSLAKLAPGVEKQRLKTIHAIRGMTETSLCLTKTSLCFTDEGSRPISKHPVDTVTRTTVLARQRQRLLDSTKPSTPIPRFIQEDSGLMRLHAAAEERIKKKERE